MNKSSTKSLHEEYKKIKVSRNEIIKMKRTSYHSTNKLK